MRVHALTLSAFGPFAGTVEVDLDAAARDGLFLLWGPTGAGKTTLLDAVVFALYGTVPGPRGEEKRLRSDHAVPDVRTEVCCEISFGEERVRVSRRPEQLRPKKRGRGVTREQARLLVQRSTPGGWEPVSTRIDEGSEYLRSRLGLSAEQFCQVVLLPQGDFARFLRAEPEDRSRLLRTLFDVERFARAEDWLADERREAVRRVDAARTQLSSVLARVAQSAEVDVPEDLAPDLLGAAGSRADRWVAQVRAGAVGREEAAAQHADDAAAEVARWEAELAAGRVVDERHERRDRARRDLELATTEEVALAPVRAQLEAGRRAEPLRDALEAAGRAAVAQERTRRAVVAAAESWDAVADGREADAGNARLLRDDAARLRGLLPEVVRSRRLTREVQRLTDRLVELERRVTRAQADLEGAPARQTAARAAVGAAERATGELPARRAEVDLRAGMLQSARDLVELRRRLATTDQLLVDRRQAWLDVRERAVDVRAARLQGMAAELATALRPGCGCPVCGAVQHPSPAVPEGVGVTADDEESAQAAVMAAEAALQEVRSELASLHTREAAALARAGDVGAAEQEEALGRARSVLASTAELAESLATVRAAADDEEAAAQAAADQLQADRVAVERVRAEIESAAAALLDLQVRLAEAADGDADVERAAARRAEAASRCEALVEARSAERATRAALADATSRLERRAAEEGFVDVAAAAGALLERAELSRMAVRLDAHGQKVAAATAALAAPDLSGLGPRPDVSAIDQERRAATRRREVAVAAAADARRRVAELTALTGELTAARIQVDARHSWALQVGSLADLVNGRGSNEMRMRLQSFVLAARLEQVAQVASRRLHDMSEGRYTFLHSDVAGRNGARGGLGLNVLDEYTGQRRHTKTLSGGESFMASLALALGLADVVTAESGGVRIDTLFVDEGFGTLDPRALDAVMGVLDQLRRGGRTVGIISHVEELRTRIPSCIEVVAGRDGSRLAG